MPFDRHSRGLTLFLPVGLFLIATSTLLFSVVQRLKEFRFRHQSRSTVLEIQRAVQDFHVAEEFYPKRTPLSGAELIALLTESGHLKAEPLNPWTGEPYRASDPTQPDGIRYRTDELAETYSLESLGRDLDPESPLWRLDSTEHQSLE